MGFNLPVLNRRRRPGGFSPVFLFSSGSQGVWYEPSDLTTMFTDRSGTIPITAPGQTVSLRLDKSKGLTLGSELVVNGDFAAGATGWTAQAGWTISSGAASVNSSVAGSTYLRTSGYTAVAGTYYRVTFTITSYTSGSIFGVAGTATSATGATALGTYSYLILSNGANGVGVYGSGTNTIATIDNISVKELPGNHAVAPTDAARPTYGIEPWSGRRNLLTRTEEFGDAVWQKITSGVGVAPVLTYGFADPDGTSTAWRLQLNAGANGASDYSLIRQSSSSWPDIGTRSIWLRSNTGSNQTVTLVATNVNFRVTVTPTWQRFESASSAGAKQLDVSVGGAGSTGATADILIWHPQFEAAATATAYQRVGTAFDVTEAGVPTVHYVQDAGTDDSFSTSSIDFSTTDKMSVFAGVRKLSDALQGIFCEFSASTSLNNGSFRMTFPGGSGVDSYGWLSKGTLIASSSVGGFAAPIANIVTGLGDISGDLAILRVNGAQVSQSTNDQGTGNYGNYPLFIGRRNNTSLPFNGRDYGILVVGKAVTPTEIAATESYLASRTSGVTL